MLPARAAATKKPEKLKAILLPDGSTTYGYQHKAPELDTLDVADITTKGKERKTDEEVVIDPDNLREIVRWKGTVMGIAEMSFPHPSEWRLTGIDKPLDKIRVKDLTRAYAEQHHVDPSCLAAWAQRIGELPANIGNRYNTAMLTPKDYMPHFKNVLHRAMLTHGKQDGDHACRVCKVAWENLQHFATCQRTGRVFEELATAMAIQPANFGLLSTKEKERFALFLLTPSGPPAPAWLNLHLLLWKYLITAITAVDTEDRRFIKYNVWKSTWDQFKWKADALSVKANMSVDRNASRGEDPPNLERKSAILSPIASLNETGAIVWNDEIVQLIVGFGTDPSSVRAP